MATIKSQPLRELLMQLRFTPEQKRRKQLDAAERLYDIIDPDREYPFAFVCYRITGFSPKADKQELIKGEQLSADLRVFISSLSGSLARPAGHLDEKVFSIDGLAKSLNVATKTIRRWQKRGLLARRFMFPDGVKRLGFMQSRVGKFLAAHADLVAKAHRFRRLTTQQKQLIITQARKLATSANLSRHQVIGRTAARIGVSHETVRSLVSSYEKQNPDKPIFNKPGGIVRPTQASEIYRLFKQGCKIADLTQRFNRTRSSIYRIVKTRRVKSLLMRKIEFTASDEFLHEDATEKILAEPLSNIQPVGQKTVRPLTPTSNSLVDYLQNLKDTPVFNREQELVLFRRYNYLKYRACITRAKIKPDSVPSSTLDEIEQYLAEAERIKETLIEANLPLVVGVARKHTISGANLAELVGEGNLSLVRAVEKFDYTRGFRFSTFASWTISKDFARKIPSQMARPDKKTAASLAQFQRELKSDQTGDFIARERARQSLAQVIRNELNEREQYVILNRFGPIGTAIRKTTKTLKEIGQDLGLTKERIRQIELGALQKLRQSLSPEEFELLTH